MMISLLLLSSFLNPALASAACGGSQVGFWTNPDGSRGGSVATTAKVQAGVVIAPGAQVCEYAQVKSGAKILDQVMVSGRAVINTGSEISGRAKVQGEAKIGGSNVTTKVGGDALVEGSAVVTGNTQVIARAKVRGGSKIHNAIICQASIIEGFNVIDSDYYCQTEDPEPAHPGELGKKTLLGVDSDRDGVRDDVEIWINDFYSNSSIEEKLAERLYAKELAKEFQISVKSKDSLETMKAQVTKLRILNDCAGFKFKINEGNFQKVVTEFYDTKERLILYFEMSKYFRLTDSPSFNVLKNVCQKFDFMKIARKKKSEY